MLLFRNKIDHAYGTINKPLLAAFIINLRKGNTKIEIQNRIEYCKENRKV